MQMRSDKALVNVSDGLSKEGQMLMHAMRSMEMMERYGTCVFSGGAMGLGIGSRSSAV